MKSMFNGRYQHGRTNPFTLAILALTIMGIIGGYFLFPMHWDYWTMKQLTRDAAREWVRSKQTKTAKEMLTANMKKKGIDEEDISVRDCDFRDFRKSFKLSCEWTSYIEIPFREAPLMKEFSVVVEVDGNGTLEQW